MNKEVMSEYQQALSFLAQLYDCLEENGRAFIFKRDSDLVSLGIAMLAIRKEMEENE